LQCNQTYQSVYKKVGNLEKDRLDVIMLKKNEFVRYLTNKYNKKELLDELNKSVIEQAFQLVITYMKLIYDCSTLLNEIYSVNTEVIEKRLLKNSRNLKTLNDADDIVKFTQAIEMDEQLLNEIQDQKNEVDLIKVKLDNIENMMSAFKNQIASSEMSNTANFQIENILNEANALDNALKKKRV